MKTVTKRLNGTTVLVMVINPSRQHRRGLAISTAFSKEDRKNLSIAMLGRKFEEMANTLEAHINTLTDKEILFYLGKKETM